jgi:hypothetical protein
MVFGEGNPRKGIHAATEFLEPIQSSTRNENYGDVTSQVAVAVFVGSLSEVAVKVIFA